MTSTPESAPGTPAENDLTYLTEPHLTEDGIEVPPPTRPMGPRRLTRYYHEAAEYIRAVQRGDAELPEVPLYMGHVEGLPVPAAEETEEGLAALSQMGTISSDNPQDIATEVDQTTHTVVHDSLADIDAQIQGEEATNPAPASPEGDLTITLAEAAPEDDFVLLPAQSSGQEEPAEAQAGSKKAAPAPEPGTVAAALSAEEEAKNPEVVAAIIARAQEKDAAYKAAHPELTEKKPVLEEPEPVAVTELFAAGPTAPALPLPEPVQAKDAQGLNLEDLDRANVTDEAHQTLAQTATGAVDSDSSEENTAAAPQAAPAGGQAPQHQGESENPHTPLTRADARKEAAEAEKTRSKAMLLVLALLLLLVVLGIVWFSFFS
ncbi:hypothetical protein [Rothia nasimurium]|uniref:hypothetical protein n=1 Tax=Rothia nasimurium TaxID=85336 RepID=UPI003B9F73AC